MKWSNVEDMNIIDVEKKAAESNLTLSIPFEFEGQKVISAKATYCEFYYARIACGLKVGYHGKTFSYEEVFSIMKRMMSIEHFCVSITPTYFVYPTVENGFENGVIVELIDYPRFPKGKEWIKTKGKMIAYELMKNLYQNRVTLTTPDYSITLENPMKIEEQS